MTNGILGLWIASWAPVGWVALRVLARNGDFREDETPLVALLVGMLWPALLVGWPVYWGARRYVARVRTARGVLR